MIGIKGKSGLLRNIILTCVLEKWLGRIIFILNLIILSRLVLLFDNFSMLMSDNLSGKIKTSLRENLKNGKHPNVVMP